MRTSIESLLNPNGPHCLDQSVADESEPRRLHLYSILSTAQEQFAVACNTLETLRTQYPDYYAVRPDAQILEASCLFDVNAVELAASLTASLYAINPKSIPPVQLKRFAPLFIDESREYDKTNIAWPIIATALRHRGIEDLSMDRVHDFVSDYIESQECVLPTELLELKSGELSKEELTFLQDCCTAEIMESSIWIESQLRLLKERLALCERIRATMAAPPTGIEGEIGLLMRKLAVLDITQRIERSRIYVDTERIKERTPESLADTATRLLATIAIANKDLNRSLKLLGMPNRGGGRVTLVSIDRGQQLFTTIFGRLRDQYLFSPELGLDANLSQSIRHGPIISGIRAIFDRSRLLTRKTTSGDYESNTYWIGAIGASGNTATVVNRAFSQLAMSVDGFISRVRDEELQIMSPETSPRGLLQYEFSDADMYEAFNKIELLHEVEDVYDIALGVLDDRTKACLQVVTNRITAEWESELLSMLTDLYSQVESVVSDGTKLSHLRSAITDCSTKISRGLEKIGGWFALEDKREHKAFTIRSLVKTFEQMAAKEGQQCVAEITPGDSGGDRMIAGIYFRSLWDLFFILFDNALKHGGLDKTTIVVEINLQQDSTCFGVANAIAEDTDIATLRERIEQLNTLSLDRSSDLVKLRSEGGSGIAKLHKIVRYEIGNDESAYSISLRTTDEREFKVDIEIEKGISDASVFSG